MTQEARERMFGLVSLDELKLIYQAVGNIKTQLLMDGFDEDEILEFIKHETELMYNRDLRIF